jgi:CBS domain-containing protein
MKTAEDILKEKGGEMICVSPHTSVRDALRLMTEHRIGAMVVKDKGKLVGIWTERDLMRNTLAEGFDPSSDEVSRYMVTGLKYASYDESVYQLQDKFLGMRLRHLLIKKKRDCIGIVSTGDVMRMLLNDMQEQLDEAKTLASWQYYENWRWR